MNTNLRNLILIIVLFWLLYVFISFSWHAPASHMQDFSLQIQIAHRCYAPLPPKYKLQLRQLFSHYPVAFIERMASMNAAQVTQLRATVSTLANNITCVMQFVYENSQHAQATYPEYAGRQQCGFMEWFEEMGCTLFDNNEQELAKICKEQQGLARKYLQQNCKFGVNVMGFLKGEFGIGETSRSTLRALRAVNVPVSLTDVKIESHRTKDDVIDKLGLVIDNTNPYMFSIVHTGICNVPAWQEITPLLNERYKIGVWNWELNGFPMQWKTCSIDHYEEVWAPSTICFDVFSEPALQPVFKIPYIVDLSDLDHVLPDRERFGIPKDAFTFLFQFDFLSYPERKNPDAALQAFKNAFPDPNEKRAYFVFKSMNVHVNQFNALEKYAAMKQIVAGHGNVLFIDEHLDRNESFRLKKTVDCFVSLHRAEGFGFNIAEAMYFGKPAIATGYSSNMDFMNTENSYPLQFEMQEIMETKGVYMKGYKWTKPSVQHASHLMRHLFENQAEAKQIGVQAAKYIREHLNPVAVGTKMKERLEFIRTHIMGMKKPWK